MYQKHFLKLLYMAFFVMLVSCNANRREMLVNTWHMSHDEMILEIRPDGSYSASEPGKNPQNGKWDLSVDGKTIKFKQRASEDEKSMQIKELEENRLVLDNNGDDMIFTTLEETIEEK